MNLSTQTPGAALRPLVLALLMGLAQSVAMGQAGAPAAASASAPAGPTLRPTVAAPLQAAQTLLREGKHGDALARIQEAEAVGELTPFETYIVQRLRAPALFSAGDTAGALTQFEAVLASPLLPVAEKAAIVETTIKLALQAKDYARARGWMEQYLADKGQSAEIVRLYPQVLSVLGDHVAVIKALQVQIDADQATGRITPEATLRMLAASQSGAGNDAAYFQTLQRLATSTGKTDYWAELITRVAARPGFNHERLRLDLYRLRQAAGIALTAGELGDMAERAQQAGLPAEAQKLLDDGFNSGLLGKDANAAADRKLREQATKSAAQDRATLAEGDAGARLAKDGNAAHGLGFALSGAGDHARAMALMALGQSKGGLRRPDEALLHLGIAARRAGQIDEARKHFAAVSGQDGAADLARLWALLPAAAAPALAGSAPSR